MAEIHLPTKATQDSIKGDTQFIRGQFPISGGTDLFASTFMTTDVVSTGGTLTTKLDVTGKGIIYHVIQRSGSNSVYEVSIEVDGQTPYFLNVPFTGTNLTIPFSESVTVKCPTNPAEYIDVYYALF